MNLSRSAQWNWQGFAKCISRCLILADPVSLLQMSKDSAPSALSSRSLKSSHCAGPSLCPCPPSCSCKVSGTAFRWHWGDPCRGSPGLVPDRGQPSGSQGRESRRSIRWVLCLGGDHCRMCHVPPFTWPLVIANQWVEVVLSRPFFLLPVLTAPIQNLKNKKNQKTKTVLS